jgi:hypothetical protein
MTWVALDKATSRDCIGAVEVRKRYGDKLIVISTNKAYTPTRMLPFPEAWQRDL